MIFFKKMKTSDRELPEKKSPSFQDIVHDRVLTAAGWKRKVERQSANARLKKK